jgi:hypothetical protein
LATAGAKLLEEKRTALEQQRKEVEELQSVKTDLEQRKAAAEEQERHATEAFDAAWNGLIFFWFLALFLIL